MQKTGERFCWRERKGSRKGVSAPSAYLKQKNCQVAMIKNNKELVLHSLVGLLGGYFILHPASMVIHWLESNNSSGGWAQFGKFFSESFVHSFSLHMMPMSLAFAILGLGAGIVSGFYYKSIKNKNQQLYGKRQLLQQSLPNLIACGKSEFVEFKSSLRYDYRQVKTDKNLEDIALKDIAGFLNANGGILIIGVDYYGQVLGLENDYWTLKKKNKDGFQQRIILLISNTFGKDICPRVHISFHEIEGKEICTLFIEPVARAVYFNEGNSTIFFLRTGNVTLVLTTSETVKYLNSRKIK